MKGSVVGDALRYHFLISWFLKVSYTQDLYYLISKLVITSIMGLDAIHQVWD
jgi:hypothetical protein